VPGFFVENFGCRATQADGAALERQFEERGVARASTPAQASIVVMNTCTVTAGADQDARAAIRRVRRQNPDARIIVTGCYAQRAPEEIAALPGVSLVVGNSHKHQLAEIVQNQAADFGLQTSDFGPLTSDPAFVPLAMLGGTSASSELPSASELSCPTPNLEVRSSRSEVRTYVSDIFAHTELLAAPVFDAANERTRPNLKIQDGCDNRCSFCVIPFVRGQSRSLGTERIISEVRALVDSGYREVVISGINLGRWGRDLDLGRQTSGFGPQTSDLGHQTFDGSFGTAPLGPPSIHVGTAALGCPGEQSSPALVGLREIEAENRRPSLVTLDLGRQTSDPGPQTSDLGQTLASEVRGLRSDATSQNPRLEALIRTILAETSLEKLRISSVEPMDWSDDLISLVASSPRIAKHAHVPMQSGSDAVLRRMHRKYRPWHYREKIEKIRAAMPDAAIGADVMVGFPGETDSEFEATRQMIEALPFTYLHVFTYSARPGTPAASMSKQVPVQVARERNRILRELAAEKKLAFMRSFVGRNVEAITLHVGGSDADGEFTEALTDNYLKLRLRGKHDANRWQTVVAQKVQAGSLVGA
jgi:tRNA A37 methylthiotransferase MiaB